MSYKGLRSIGERSRLLWPKLKLLPFMGNSRWPPSRLIVDLLSKLTKAKAARWVSVENPQKTEVHAPLFIAKLQRIHHFHSWLCRRPNGHAIRFTSSNVCRKLLSRSGVTNP